MEQPKYKLGDIVFIQSEKDNQKILQGEIIGAEFVNEWFYSVKAFNPCGEDELIYTYEEDTGDAKTKFI